MKIGLVRTNISFIAGGRKRWLYRRRGRTLYVRFEHNGKSIPHSLGTNVEAAAKLNAKTFIDDILKCDRLTAADATFDLLIARFIAGRAAKGRGTVANDKAFANRLRSTFHMPMSTLARQIRTGDILAWLNEQATKRKWGNRTWNHYRLWLWQIFALGVADRLMLPEENPFHGKMIRRKRPEKVVRNIPTDEQFAAIIAAVRSNDGDEVADFLEFLGTAGVGQAEALAMKWIDIGTEKIKFVRRKTGIPFDVPIYKWLAPVIARLYVRRNGAEPNEPVFQVPDASKALRAACDRLELMRFTQRGLRAMVIKRLYDAGVPAKRIALWQGHRDGGKLIQEIYTEVFCDTDAAAEKADLALVGGACNPAAENIAAVA
jgi:integrase